MDDQRRPRTSVGVDANTTFNPGMCTNHASSCCACCAPGDQPLPPCVRNVTGTVTCPPDMYRCFAAWLTTCSAASVRKSSYMISATGRMPWSAAPIAAPASAISEIGVLRTRSRPNSSSIPCVTPIEPPISAMSSPMTKTSSSCRMACTSAARTASRYECSGIDVLQGVLGRGIGAVLRELDRSLDDLRHLGVELVELLVRDAELLPQQRDRIAGRAEPAGLLLVAVHLRVADVVAGEALGVEVDEDGPLAGAEALLDLLLEAADEQHLAQRVEKVALRECRLRFHLRHGAQSMVRAMALVDQWNSIESGLDPRWSDARLMLTVGDDAARDRAAALLAPAGPGRSGRTLRFYTARGGAGVGPEAIRTMLRRIDAERIDGTLELVSSDEAPPVAAIARPSLAAEWDAARAALPTDWSEVLCELELTSTDHLERAALLLAPLNPVQGTGRPGFRFRCASVQG